MPKKPTKKLVKQGETNHEDAASVAKDTMLDALLFLRTEIRGIADKSIKPKGHDAASRIAWLTEKVARIDGERRKGAAAEDRRLGRITYDDVIEWARRQSRDLRARLIRDLIALDAKGSVLG